MWTPGFSRRLSAGFLCLAVGTTASAQPTGPGQGRAAEAWHWIQKLQTTGSVLHVTAHPDDENGALLALLSRGHGVRTALLSLTRGEAGANAIGPELFDGLGLIRAAELEAAGNWYGLDRIYYTPLADYGYSKNLDEALRSWDEEAAAADVVEVIRRERPMVVLARFTGDPRDGHGQHQFAGRMAARGFDGAPDMGAFPAREGRRPHLPFAFFQRARDEERALEIDVAGSRPWLSHSFAELNAIGLSYQRSQTRGVVRPVVGRGRARLMRADSDPDTGNDLLAMLGPERASLSARFGPVVPARLMAVLERLDAHFRAVAAEFDWSAPEASLPRLGEALAEGRELLSERSPSGFFDVRHELERKEEQLVAAIRAAAGVSFEALASEPAAESGGSPFAPPPAFGPAVPGQRFAVRVNASALAPARVAGVSLDVPGEVQPAEPEGGTHRFVVTLAADAPVLQPHVERSGLGESRYRANGDWTLGAPAHGDGGNPRSGDSRGRRRPDRHRRADRPGGAVRAEPSLRLRAARTGDPAAGLGRLRSGFRGLSLAGADSGRVRSQSDGHRESGRRVLGGSGTAGWLPGGTRRESPSSSAGPARRRASASPSTRTAWRRAPTKITANVDAGSGDASRCYRLPAHRAPGPSAALPGASRLAPGCRRRVGDAGRTPGRLRGGRR